MRFIIPLGIFCTLLGGSGLIMLGCGVVRFFVAKFQKKSQVA
jgi:hypothetical protein